MHAPQHMCALLIVVYRLQERIHDTGNGRFENAGAMTCGTHVGNVSNPSQSLVRTCLYGVEEELNYATMKDVSVGLLTQEARQDPLQIKENMLQP